MTPMAIAKIPATSAGYTYAALCIVAALVNVAITIVVYTGDGSISYISILAAVVPTVVAWYSILDERRYRDFAKQWNHAMVEIEALDPEFLDAPPEHC